MYRRPSVAVQRRGCHDRAAWKSTGPGLLQQSRAEGRHTPMEAVIEAARQGRLQAEEGFRLIGRLWTLERLFYYIYGGWGQGLEIGDFPPSVKYLFARQIMDESTHEMVYLDTLLREQWVRTQKEAFQHPYGQFKLDSAVAYYAFSLRNLATYPHPIRIAALNLGAKVVELSWMEGVAEALAGEALRAVFTSQFVENRSHINMGRRIVEECARSGPSPRSIWNRATCMTSMQSSARAAGSAWSTAQRLGRSCNISMSPSMLSPSGVIFSALTGPCMEREYRLIASDGHLQAD